MPASGPGSDAPVEPGPAARALFETASDLVGDARLAQFVVEVLRGLGSAPGLILAAARGSAFSRPDGWEQQWLRLTPGAGEPGDATEEPADAATDELLDAAVASAEAAGSDEPARLTEGRFALVRALGGQRRFSRRQGYLVALFSGEEAARAASVRASRLCDDLAVGLALRRQAADAAALVLLSSALADSGGDPEGIRRALEITRVRTRSDGVEVLALRRTGIGPRIERAGDTGTMPRWGVARDRGQADWVIHHDDWLIVDEVPARRGKDPDRGHSGRHGAVEVVARPRGDARPGPASYPDRVALSVPLHLHERCVGVLAVWRTTDEPYDPDLDRAALSRMAQQITFGVRWLAQGETTRRAHEETLRLEHLVAAGASPGDLYREVAAASARVARAARGVLLLHDGDGRFFAAGDYLHIAIDGDSDGDGDKPKAAPHQPARFLVHCRGAAKEWPSELAAALSSMPELRQQGARSFVLRACMPLSATGAGDGVVALFDPEPAEHEVVSTFDDSLIGDAVRSLLDQSAPVVLHSHPRSFARFVSERIGDPPEATPEAWREVLRRAADVLHERLQADAVLVYEMEDKGPVVRYAAPATPPAIELPAVPGSLTVRCVSERAARRVLDVGDPSDGLQRHMDRPSLSALAQAFGWRGVRSWLCHPVLQDDRCVGVIKVLTRDGGEYLGSAAAEAVAAVAARAGGALSWLQRAAMLDSLNHISVAVANLEGNRLARSICEKLEEWASRYVQRRCHVALVASVNQPRPKLYAACNHIDERRFEEENRAALESFFSVWSARPPQGLAPPPPRLRLSGALASAHLLLLPINAAGHKTLVGWLLLAAEAPFAPGDRAVAAEAAREASFFLLQAHRRYIWSHQLASFRHAVIGPVQGLASAAQELAFLASDAGVDDGTVSDLRARIEAEAEAVRLCWENERIYTTGGNVKVTRRRQALRPLIDKCFHRFEGMLRARGIKLVLDWPAQGSLVFPFDETALDVVLSNLLDNARKYAFYNQPVTISVTHDGQFISIAVENIGHPIPERLRDSIYRVGERLDWVDPIRTIDGTGLGLPMAHALVASHGGQLLHQSTPLRGGGPEGAPLADGSGQEPVDAEGRRIAPHRVRFEVLLPHEWSKGRGSPDAKR